MSLGDAQFPEIMSAIDAPGQAFREMVVGDQTTGSLIADIAMDPFAIAGLATLGRKAAAKIAAAGGTKAVTREAFKDFKAGLARLNATKAEARAAGPLVERGGVRQVALERAQHADANATRAGAEDTFLRERAAVDVARKTGVRERFADDMRTRVDEITKGFDEPPARAPEADMTRLRDALEERERQRVAGETRTFEVDPEGVAKEQPSPAAGPDAPGGDTPTTSRTPDLEGPGPRGTEPAPADAPGAVPTLSEADARPQVLRDSKNEPYPYRVEQADVDELVVSEQRGEFQARDLTTATERAKVDDMAAKLDLEQLRDVESQTPTVGSPVAWRDEAGKLHVVAGNGRTLAMRRAGVKGKIPVRVVEGDRARAAQLAMRSQDSPAAPRSRIGRAVERARGAGIGADDTPGAIPAQGVDARNVGAFVADRANERFVKKLKLAGDPEAQAVAVNEALLGLLPEGVQRVAEHAGPAVADAIEGAAGPLLGLRSAVRAKRLDPSFDLLGRFERAAKVTEAYPPRSGESVRAYLKRLVDEAETKTLPGTENVLGELDDVDLALTSLMRRIAGGDRQNVSRAMAEALSKVRKMAERFEVDPRQARMFAEAEQVDPTAIIREAFPGPVQQDAKFFRQAQEKATGKVAARRSVSEPEVADLPDGYAGRRAAGGSPTSAPTTKTGAARAPEDIANDLQAGLGFAIRYGKTPAGKRAVFGFERKAVTLGKSGTDPFRDMGHEVAHGLQARVIPALDADEMKAFGRFTKQGDSVEEGFAEGVAWWLAGDDVGKHAPKFEKAWDDWLGANPAEAKVLRKARADVIASRPMADPKAHLLSLIAEPGSRPKAKYTLAQAARVSMFDDLAVMEDFERSVNKGKTLPPELSPTETMRMVRRTAPGSTAEYVMTGRLHTFNPENPIHQGVSIPDIVAVAKGDKKLTMADRWASLRGKGPAAEAFQDTILYRVAQRVITHMDRGIEQAADYAAAKAFVAKHEGTSIAKAADMLTEFQNAPLEMVLREKGLSKEAVEEAVEAMEALDPFYIMLQKDPAAFAKAFPGSGTGGGYVNTGTGIKTLKGSAVGKYRDPVEAMLQQIEARISIAGRMRAGRLFVEMSEAAGGMGKGVGKWIHPVDTTAAIDVPVNAYMQALGDLGVDLADDTAAEVKSAVANIQALMLKPDVVIAPSGGKMIAFETSAPLAEALRGVPPEQASALVSVIHGMNMPRPLERLATAAAQPLKTVAKGVRLGATGLNAGFVLVGNILRDVPTAFLFGDGGKLFDKVKHVPIFGEVVGGVESAAYAIKGLGRAAAYPIRRFAGGRDQIVEAMRAAGKQVSGESVVDYAAMENLRSRMLSDNVFRDTFNVVTSPVEFAQRALSFTEAGPRLGAAEMVARRLGWSRGKTLTEKQMWAMLKAYGEATTDFNRSGTWGRWINQRVPFFNATQQGLSRAYRMAKNNPQRFIVRGTVAVTLPSFVEWGLYRDDPTWQDREDWDAGGFYRLPYGMKYPKPFVQGNLFGTLPVAIVNGAYTGKLGAEAKRAAKALAQEIPGLAGVVSEKPPGAPGPLKLFPTDLIPAAALYPLEVFANWDFFRARPIVSPFDRQQLSEDRLSKQWGTELSKKLVELMPWLGSPAMLDHLFNGPTGGQYGAVDRMIFRHSPGPLENHPSGMAVFGRLWSRPGVGKSVQELYDEIDLLSKERNSHAYDARKESRSARAAEIAGEVALRRFARTPEGRRLDALIKERKAIALMLEQAEVKEGADYEAALAEITARARKALGR